MQSTRWQSLLKAALVLGIFLAAGPEIFAAIELTVLLELFGATLFLTAFHSGLRLLFIDALAIARRMFLPAMPLLVIRYGRGPFERGGAIVDLVYHAGWWIIFFAIGVACVSHAL